MVEVAGLPGPCLPQDVYAEARTEPELSGDRPEDRVQGPVGGCCRVRALERDAVAAGEGDVVAAQRAEPLDVNVVEHVTARRGVVQGALVSPARRAASDHGSTR